MGTYLPGTGVFYLDYDRDGLWSGTSINRKLAGFFAISQEDDVLIIGDWDGDVTGQISIYRPSKRRFYIDMNANGLWDSPTDSAHRSGASGDVPIIGCWKSTAP